MKAVSVKQPWALAIASGLKTIETRTWSTDYRGPILIVASKKPDAAQLKMAMEETDGEIAEKIEYGKALATANLVDCRPMTEEDEDAAMCEVYPGTFSWVLADIVRMAPFEQKGQLGLYDVDFEP